MPSIGGGGREWRKDFRPYCEGYATRSVGKNLSVLGGIALRRNRAQRRPCGEEEGVMRRFRYHPAAQLAWTIDHGRCRGSEVDAAEVRRKN